MRARSLFFALSLLSAACGEESTGPIITRPDTGTGAKDATVIPTDSGQVDTGESQDSGQGTTCDANPAGCEAGRLRGPAPACQCLSGCEPGFTWNGTG